MLNNESIPVLPSQCIRFLKLLKRNNNREWFNSNKEAFLTAQQAVEIFADALLKELNRHDFIETPSGKKSLGRIYRDIRFSVDKTPYKTSWNGHFKRATRSRRGGYYFHVEPANKSFIAGGFWAPGAPDLKRIRDDIAFDPAPLKKILKSKSFVEKFGTLQGEQLKKVPRGYQSSGEVSDLLRYKQFLLIRKFNDEEITDTSFFSKASQTFRSMRPFFDYMSDVLSTDVNGESLI